MPPTTELDDSLVEEFLGAILTLTAAGEILTWSRAAEALCQYTAAEAVSCSLVKLLVPADRQEVMHDQLRQALESGGTAFETEIDRRDGSSVFVTVTLNTVPSVSRMTVITTVPYSCARYMSCV